MYRLGPVIPKFDIFLTLIPDQGALSYSEVPLFEQSRQIAVFAFEDVLERAGLVHEDF